MKRTHVMFSHVLEVILNGGMKMPDCKWCKDEICVNADCSMCCDYCPVPDIDGVCRFEEREGEINADLIDRAALLKSLEYNPLKRSIVQPKSTFGIILSAPAVDSVEVVRCKDCKYNRLTNGSIKVKSYSCNCTWSPCRGRIVEPSFFCFYGERKTE